MMGLTARSADPSVPAFEDAGQARCLRALPAGRQSVPAGGARLPRDVLERERGGRCPGFACN